MLIGSNSLDCFCIHAAEQSLAVCRLGHVDTTVLSKIFNHGVERITLMTAATSLLLSML